MICGHNQGMKAITLILIVAGFCHAGFVPPPADYDSVVEPYIEPARNVFGPDESVDLSFAFDNKTSELDAFDRLFFWYGDTTVGLPFGGGSAPYWPRIIEQHNDDEFYAVTYRLNTAWTFPGRYVFEADSQFTTASGDASSDQWKFDFAIVPEPDAGLLLALGIPLVLILGSLHDRRFQGLTRRRNCG